jgi:SAM-dependent methyltransferase
MAAPDRNILTLPDRINEAGVMQTAFKQDEVNRAVYFSPGVYRSYLSKLLTPPETACLLKHQAHIFGRDVLDIGVGAGRTARYLAPLAARYEAVDYSPVMVAYMKSAMPEVSVRQLDFRDLGVFGDQSFDFVFATDNVIDALAHDDRLRALREACRVLRPGGILAFSSHNIHHGKAFSGPRLHGSSNPVRFAANCVNYVRGWRNHVRVASLRRTTSTYALLNDPGHHFACLHYYVARSEVRSQLQSAGMRLIEAFDANGQIAPEGQDDSENSSLTYVAERLPGASPKHND